MPPLTPQQKEALRHAVLEFLALRHPAAFPPRAIRRTVANEVDFNFVEEDVAAACQFLIGLEYVRVLPDSLGSTNYFSALPPGVLAAERGLKPR